MGNVLKQIVFVTSVLDVHCTISTPSLSLTVVFIFIRLRVPPYINHVLNLNFFTGSPKKNEILMTTSAALIYAERQDKKKVLKVRETRIKKSAY